MEDEKKTPLEDVIEQALDLFLYAPLGLALTARDSLPSLIEKGRKQVGQQTALAKMMGQYAMKEGEKRVRQRVESFTPPPAPARSASPKPAAGPATPTTPAEAKVEPRADESTDITVEPAQAHTSNGSSVADQQPPSESDVKPPAEPKPSADHLAIPGYDTLSASQVVQRLPGLSADELDAVRAYEESTRGRRTILTKISQLQSA